MDMLVRSEPRESMSDYLIRASRLADITLHTPASAYSGGQRRLFARLARPEGRARDLPTSSQTGAVPIPDGCSASSARDKGFVRPARSSRKSWRSALPLDRAPHMLDLPFPACAPCRWPPATSAHRLRCPRRRDRVQLVHGPVAMKPAPRRDRARNGRGEYWHMMPPDRVAQSAASRLRRSSSWHLDALFGACGDAVLRCGMTSNSRRRGDPFLARSVAARSSTRDLMVARRSRDERPTPWNCCAAALCSAFHEDRQASLASPPPGDRIGVSDRPSISL